MVEKIIQSTASPSFARSATKTQARAQRWLLLAVVPAALVTLIFLVYFAVYLVYARSLFAFPFDYDQGEGFEVYDAVRLARGEGIYLDNARFPFYASNYPPVYRLMLVPLIWLFGPQVWVGRSVAFASSLAIGALIFLAARRMWRVEGGERRAIAQLVPLLAALTFFAANYVYHVGPLARAHLPMVMFAFAGIYALACAFDSSQPSPNVDAVGNRPQRVRQALTVALGVGLLLIAGFTKLQAVDAVAAGFAFLLIHRPRWGGVALVAGGALTAVIVLGLNALTAGQFWVNVVLANVNEYDIAVTWQTYAEWFRLQAVLIICSAIYVIWDGGRAIRARSLRAITIWSLYFVAASAMGMLTGKWGAGPTYLIAAIAASCVCTVGLISRLAHRVSRMLHYPLRDGSGDASAPSPFALPLALVLAASLFFVQSTLNVHLPTSGRVFGAVARVIGVADAPSSYPPYPYYDSAGFTQLGHLLDPADSANGWALVEMIRQVEGPVWSEEAMLTLLAGKDVVTNPTQLLNLSKNGMLDTTHMIAMIEQRAFGAVVFRALFYPEDVKAAIFRNYYWARSFRMNGFDYWVLLPIED